MWQSSKLGNGLRKSAAPIYGVALTVARGVPPLRAHDAAQPDQNMSPQVCTYAATPRVALLPRRVRASLASSSAKLGEQVRHRRCEPRARSQHLAHGRSARLIVAGGCILDVEGFNDAVFHDHGVAL